MALFDNMKRCSQCNSVMVGKGRERGQYRFCSENCEKAKCWEVAKAQIPEQQIEAAINEIRKGPCPKCRGGVPVDLYASHRIWSAIRITSRSTHNHLTCRACARSEQWKSLAFSAVLGWWGVPWGLYTPWYIWQNVQELQKEEANPEARAALRQSVLTQMGAKLITGPVSQIPGPPIPSPTALNSQPAPASAPTNPMQTHT